MCLTKKAILAIDVGTTNLKFCIFNGDNCDLLFNQVEEICLINSKDDQIVEIDPNQLWTQILMMIKNSVAEAEKMNLNIVGIGLSCQRNSFVTLNRKTLEPCHRIITWKDKRAQKFCEKWNNSFKRKFLNLIGFAAFTLTRSERFKAAEMFKLLDVMVAPRFLVTLEENPKMRELLSTDDLLIATLDCWILQKLTNNSQIFVTEPSSASSTGLFDPFTLGDAQAAAFGAGCFKKGDVNLTLGTGALLDFVTGEEVHASMCGGVYPLIGWKLDEYSSVYLLESKFNNVISSIKWAYSIDLISSLSPIDLNKHCEELFNNEGLLEQDEDNLCFIPSFSGSEKQNKNGDYSALFGICTNTNKDQITRSIFKSIVFGIYQIWTNLLSQLSSNDVRQLKRLRCCGGVSLNNFFCQQICTLINIPLERVSEPQFCSAKGVALLAGFTKELWTFDQIEDFIVVERCFEPIYEQRQSLLRQYNCWLNFQKRFGKF